MQEWMKARTSLRTDLRFLRVVKHLRASSEFREWLGGELKDEALRHVVFSVLCAFWDAVRVHGRPHGEDLVLEPAELEDLDAFSAPGIGAALAAAGWAIEGSGSVTLPRYGRYNGPRTDRERQEAARRRAAEAAAQEAQAKPAALPTGHTPPLANQEPEPDKDLQRSLPERDASVTDPLRPRDERVIDLDQEKNIPPHPPPLGGRGGGTLPRDRSKRARSRDPTGPRRPDRDQQPHRASPEVEAAWAEFRRLAPARVGCPEALEAHLRARGCEHPDLSGYAWWRDRHRDGPIDARRKLLAAVQALEGRVSSEGVTVDRAGLLGADQTLTPWCRVPTAALERALKLLEPQKAATG